MGTIDSLADGVLVINLDERQDRWRSVLGELGPYVDVARLRRLPAVKGVELKGFGRPPLFRGRARDKTWAGRAGCALSHREAIAYAARKGWRSVLVLEDDIQVDANFEMVCGVLPEILACQDWDLCYLGFTDPVGPFREEAKLGLGHSLFRIYGCNTAHAYLVRNTVYDALLKRMPDRETIWTWLACNRAIDRWYMRSFSGSCSVFAVSPAIIDQKQGVSDITGREQERVHITTVPGNARHLLPYPAARILRRAEYMVANAYDFMRGLIKIRRGF